ncbi:MAG: nuclear transport factor 2 family protein [Rhodothermaceae bacterium]|nr:nuclear transport factor 2 family protein [Rhodothermaceae bacterium]
MRRLLLLSALLLGFASSAQAQDQSFEAVLVPLNLYLQSHATGSGEFARQAFHPEAKLFWIRDGAVSQRTAEEYLSGFSGEPAENEAERHRRIVDVNVTGNVATATIELDYPGAMITDYMTLIEVDGAWKIINKAFYVNRRPE